MEILCKNNIRICFFLLDFQVKDDLLKVLDSSDKSPMSQSAGNMSLLRSPVVAQKQFTPGWNLLPSSSVHQMFVGIPFLAVLSDCENLGRNVPVFAQCVNFHLILSVFIYWSSECHMLLSLFVRIHLYIDICKSYSIYFQIFMNFWYRSLKTHN